MAKVLMATITIRAVHPPAVLLPQGCTMEYFQDMKVQKAKQNEKERKEQQNRGSANEMVQGNPDQKSAKEENQPSSTVDNDDTPAQLKPSSKPARNRCCMDWMSEDFFPYLKDAIIQKCLHPKLRRKTFHEGKLGPLPVPESTVRSAVKRIKAREEISIETAFGKEKKGSLSCENCQALQDIISISGSLMIRKGAHLQRQQKTIMII
eukprot:9075803-Ditylum_brightwellii.AAC.1